MFKSKKERKKENMKQETKVKGISLITLVITIIIIIILAGAIILSLTNSDVIGKASLAKESNDFTSIRQMVEMERANAMFEGNEFDPSKITIPDTYSNEIEIIDKDTVIIKGVTNSKITDIPNAVEKLGAVYIPKGFLASKVTGEMSKKDGLVIYEGTTSATDSTVEVDRTTKNQFVWIPVENISDFGRKNPTWDTSITKLVWDLPDSQFKGYDELESEQQPAEYKAMRTSVRTYKGFYVARYEAGIPSNVTQTKPSADTTTSWGDGTYKPVIQKDKFVWNYLKWSNSSTTGEDEPSGYAGDPTQNGVVKVSRALYPNTDKLNEYVLPSNLTNTTGAISTLIYAEQWDATMNFFEEIMNTNIDPSKPYIINNTGMGNHSDSDSNNNPAKTGDSAYLQDSVKNIYDMSGNVFEYTMEAYSNIGRVYRGGFYNYTGNVSVSYRYGANGPSAISPSTGFRIALYVK